MPVTFSVTVTSYAQRQDFSFGSQDSGKEDEKWDHSTFWQIVTTLVYNSGKPRCCRFKLYSQALYAFMHRKALNFKYFLNGSWRGCDEFFLLTVAQETK